MDKIDTIKRDSTFPPLSFYFLDEDGNPANCALFEVKLVIKNKRGGVIVNTIVGDDDGIAVWLDESQGIGQYEWVDGDTEKTGRYKYEFKFKRLADNRRFKLPEEDYFYYLVIEDIPIEEEEEEEI